MGELTQLSEDGWTTASTTVAPEMRDALKSAVFAHIKAGERCLLDVPVVRDAAIHLRTDLVHQGLLTKTAVAIQAIAFDKSPRANWKVSWHQDVMFPLGRAATSPAYELSTTKEGVPYARPPRSVLEEMLAVRLHLDPCATENGPLRVVPGSHRLGILRSGEITPIVEKLGETTCLADEGEAVVMRPLILHASSPARAPTHRRVLHVVFHTGRERSEPWHRSI